MDYLLSGSLAYDTILIHEGEFHHKILPHEISRLNVAFGIDNIRVEYGGTGGNIAYNSSLLNISPMLVASVGDNNCNDYIEHLKSLGIHCNHLSHVPKENTASAWIMTDVNNNQITGFYPGAMKHTPKLPDKTPNLWHLAPDSPITTLTFAKEAVKQKKKYFLDPGQALFGLIQHKDDTETTLSFSRTVKHANGLFLNDYESLVLCEKMDCAIHELFEESSLEFVVVTRGGDGGILHTKDKQFNFPVAKAEKIVDPTGCGDAFRAGFISQYIKKQSLENCVLMGAVMGSFAISCSGGQNHKPYFEDIYTKFHELI